MDAKPVSIAFDRSKDAEEWIRNSHGLPSGDHYLTYFAHHQARLSRSMAAVPMPVREDASLLELACFRHLLPYFKNRLGYSRVAGTHHRTSGPVLMSSEIVAGSPYDFATVDVEQDIYPFDDETFDTVLCWELLEHMAFDPMHMLAEANRITRMGGQLFISTPNIASARSLRALLWGGQPQLYPAYPIVRSLDRHHIEYAPPEIYKLMASAGFEVERFWTEDFYSDDHGPVLEILRSNGFPTDLRGDTTLVIGRKVCGVNIRYPTPIYDDVPAKAVQEG